MPDRQTPPLTRTRFRVPSSTAKIVIRVSVLNRNRLRRVGGRPDLAHRYVQDRPILAGRPLFGRQDALDLNAPELGGRLHAAREPEHIAEALLPDELIDARAVHRPGDLHLLAGHGHEDDIARAKPDVLLGPAVDQVVVEVDLGDLLPAPDHHDVSKRAVSGRPDR